MLNEQTMAMIAMLSPILVAISQVVKAMGLPTKYIPLSNVLLGIVISYVMGGVADVQTIIMNGVVLGLSASGLYSGTKATMEKVQG